MQRAKITIQPLGGLANRIHCLASGIFLAHTLGEQIRVVWQRNDELHADFHDLFDFHDPTVVFERPSAFATQFLYSPPRRRNLYLSAIPQRLQFGLRLIDSPAIMPYLESSEMVIRDVKKALSCGHNIYVASGYEFYDYPDELLRTIMMPSKAVTERLANIRKNLPKDNSHLYGLHIRRTDHRFAIENCPSKLFSDRVGRIIDSDPEACFFLATDDDHEKHLLANFFPQRIVYSTKTATRSSTDGMIDATAEMLTLAACSRIIGSYGSTFCSLAARLTGIPIEKPHI